MARRQLLSFQQKEEAAEGALDDRKSNFNAVSTQERIRDKEIYLQHTTQSVLYPLYFRNEFFG